MTAHKLLRGVFEVVLAKAESDPAFAAELTAALGARRAERERARPAAPAVSSPALDLDALYRTRGRLQFEAHLSGRDFTLKQLKAIAAREDVIAPAGRTVKSDWAYAIAREVARRNGDAELESA